MASALTRISLLCVGLKPPPTESWSVFRTNAAFATAHALPPPLYTRLAGAGKPSTYAVPLALLAALATTT